MWILRGSAVAVQEQQSCTLLISKFVSKCDCKWNRHGDNLPSSTQKAWNYNEKYIGISVNRFVSRRWRIQTEQPKERLLAVVKKAGHWTMAWVWSHIHTWASASWFASTFFSSTSMLKKHEQHTIARLRHYWEVKTKNIVCEAHISPWCTDSGTQERKCHVREFITITKRINEFTTKRTSTIWTLCTHKQCTRT